MRRGVVLALSWTLAAAGLAGCRPSDGTGNITDLGNFFLTVSGHGGKTFQGGAQFSVFFEDGAEITTFAFFTESSEFELVFSIRDFRGTPELIDVSVDPELYSGHFAYTLNGERRQYEINGGTFTVEQVERFLVTGELALTGIVSEGENEGANGSASGSWRAVCEGDCLGGSGPPPGS
jgi:hypothetical protein